MYDGHLPTHQMVQVSLGVKRDLSSEPHWITHLLDQPFLLVDEERREIGVKHYCYDASLAPHFGCNRFSDLSFVEGCGTGFPDPAAFSEDSLA